MTRIRNVILLVGVLQIAFALVAFADTRNANEQIKVTTSTEHAAKTAFLNNERGVRVSRVSGGSYDQIRVSRVWKRTSDNDTEGIPFRHRWKQFSFSTQIVHTPTTFPEPGASVKGIMLGDVCISSKYVPCTFGATYGTFAKITWVLNALGREGLHFWAMLGDNLYDEDGSITEQFFNALSADIERVPLLAVPGNHDYWTRGIPSDSPNNQFGYGYAQYYMVDVEAARLNSKHSFPFSFPPESANVSSVPDDSNFFHYSAIGGAGFIAFSGAHAMDTEKFETACKYFTKGHPGQDVGFVFLLSHWSSKNLGCETDMYSAKVHEIMSNPNGPMNKYCYGLAAERRLFYVDGHFHENRLLSSFGMRVGGQGMIDTGTFGFPLFQVLDEKESQQKRLLVSYIALAKFIDDPLVHFRFLQLKLCSAFYGVFGCVPKLDFVETWLNVTTSYR